MDRSRNNKKTHKLERKNIENECAHVSIGLIEDFFFWPLDNKSVIYAHSI